MSDLVPVGQGSGGVSLLFEPSQSVNARTLALQTEVEQLRRSRGRQRGIIFLLLILLIATLVGAGIWWFMNSNQISAAQAQVREAQTARETAIKDQAAAEARADQIAEDSRALRAYEPISSMTAEVRRLRQKHASYKSMLEGKPTPTLDREAALLDADIPREEWTIEKQREELAAQQTALNNAIEAIERWIRVQPRNGNVQLLGPSGDPL